MKYEINLKGIEKHAPSGFRLPATFDAFVDACQSSSRGDLGWFSVKYTKPNESLGFDASKEVLPVLRLADGGFVAFWFCTPSRPAVISCSSEGEVKVVGASWPDFLSRMTKKRTGVPDLDERESRQLPKIRGVQAELIRLTRHRKLLESWLSEHQQDQTGDSPVSEQIRGELVRLMAADLEADRRDFEKLLGCKLDEDDDHTAMVDIVVHLTSRSFKIEKPSGRPYPNARRLRPVLDRLVAYLGRSLKNSKISIWSDGKVFVEGNTCLGDPTLYD